MFKKREGGAQDPTGPSSLVQHAIPVVPALGCFTVSYITHELAFTYCKVRIVLISFKLEWWLSEIEIIVSLAIKGPDCWSKESRLNQISHPIYKSCIKKDIYETVFSLLMHALVISRTCLRNISHLCMVIFWLLHNCFNLNQWYMNDRCMDYNKSK